MQGVRERRKRSLWHLSIGDGRLIIAWPAYTIGVLLALAIPFPVLAAVGKLTWVALVYLGGSLAVMHWIWPTFTALPIRFHPHRPSTVPSIYLGFAEGFASNLPRAVFGVGAITVALWLDNRAGSQSGFSALVYRVMAIVVSAQAAALMLAPVSTDAMRNQMRWPGPLLLGGLGAFLSVAFGLQKGNVYYGFMMFVAWVLAICVAVLVLPRFTPFLTVPVVLIEHLRVVVAPMAVFMSGYLVIVLSFAGMYSLLEGMNPGSFHLPDGTAPAFPIMCYYSLVTMATVGYGDIYPQAWQARLLASFEVIVGMAWTTVVFAMTVAMAQRSLSQVKLDGNKEEFMVFDPEAKTAREHERWLAADEEEG